MQTLTPAEMGLLATAVQLGLVPAVGNPRRDVTNAILPDATRRPAVAVEGEVVCYHGTSYAQGVSIKRDGLRPHWRRPGGRVDNQPGPYVAAHPWKSVCYALRAAAQSETCGVIYTVHVPSDELRADMLGLGTIREFCLRAAVPSSQITGGWMFDAADMVEQLRRVAPEMPPFQRRDWYGGLGAWAALEALNRLEKRAAALGVLGADVWPSPSGPDVEPAKSMVHGVLRSLREHV